MVPPRWPGESTVPCPRCGRDAPLFHLKVEHLKMVGWQAYRVEGYGHGQAVIPWPQRDGTVRLIPVLGEAV